MHEYAALFSTKDTNSIQDAHSIRGDHSIHEAYSIEDAYSIQAVHSIIHIPTMNISFGYFPNSKSIFELTSRSMTTNLKKFCRCAIVRKKVVFPQLFSASFRILPFCFGPQGQRVWQNEKLICGNLVQSGSLLPQ